MIGKGDFMDEDYSAEKEQVMSFIRANVKDDKITIDKFIQIFKIGLKNSELGKIPEVQDQIIVGDVDRSRSHKVKATFIIGLNDGVFQNVKRDEGFLNDYFMLYFFTFLYKVAIPIFNASATFFIS